MLNMYKAVEPLDYQVESYYEIKKKLDLFN